MSSGLKERVRVLLGVLGARANRKPLSQKELAQVLRVSPQYLSDILNGRKARFAWESLEGVVEAGINLNWFVSGVGPILRDEVSDQLNPDDRRFLDLAIRHPEFAGRLMELDEGQLQSLYVFLSSLSNRE